MRLSKILVGVFALAVLVSLTPAVQGGGWHAAKKAAVYGKYGIYPPGYGWPAGVVPGGCDGACPACVSGGCWGGYSGNPYAYATMPYRHCHLGSHLAGLCLHKKLHHQARWAGCGWSTGGMCGAGGCGWSCGASCGMTGCGGYSGGCDGCSGGCDGCSGVTSDSGDIIMDGSEMQMQEMETNGPVPDQSAGISGSPFHLAGYRYDASANFEKGLSSYRSGSMSDALGAFNEAAQADRSNALNLYYRALATFSLYGEEAADDALQQAVSAEQSEPIANWGKKMERVQGRGRVWVEKARRQAGLVR